MCSRLRKTGRTSRPCKRVRIKHRLYSTSRKSSDQTDRFIALGEYDVKAETTVKFAVGSSKIAAADQEELKKLAQTATGLKGYIVEVTGYADATGGAEMNTKLSEARAKAVTIF